jgi:hypothetical protein
VIRADDLARAMVDVAVQGTDRGVRVFENRDIRATVGRSSPNWSWSIFGCTASSVDLFEFEIS